MGRYGEELARLVDLGRCREVKGDMGRYGEELTRLVVLGAARARIRVRNWARVEG